MSGPDAVRVTTLVGVAPETAFAVFTEEVDAWWRREPRFRFSPGRTGVLRFESGTGGRLVEIYDEGAGDLFEIGRVRIWEPPRRLVFGFRTASFEREETTEVEVLFERAESGTRVTIEHRGWSGLPARHPARRGLSGGAFTSMIGAQWGDLVVRLRHRLAGRSVSP